MILAVAGPSGSGKSRMLSIASEHCGFWRPVAWTTRPPRRDEVDGQDYEFVDRERFKEAIRRRGFTDWDYTIGNYYGYTRELAELHSDRAAIVAITGRVGLRLAERLTGVYLLYLDGDDEVLSERLRARGVGEREIILRESHRDEEREHAGLYDERRLVTDDWPDDEVVAYLQSIRSAF